MGLDSEISSLMAVAIIGFTSLLAHSGNPPALPGDCPSLTFPAFDMENSLP